ncbi:NAD(P)-binding protein, partial [Achromobacter sp.]|uniref:NAD(P)-binding protein n=1 Tax=Achromobacter sp. TaxID=134375 RepID=UPI000EE5429E|nr:FAD-dependent oxidoreductase [Achromobacter sp.]
MDTQMPFDTSRPPRAATPGPNAYNPTYDPLVSPPGRGQDYAPTYWVASAGDPPEDDGPIQGDVDADMVIVGSGFTGLSAALTLARDFGVRAVVLEA